MPNKRRVKKELIIFMDGGPPPVGSVHILRNKIFPNPGPISLCNQNNHCPPPLKWLSNMCTMCTEVTTFDVDNATKDYKKIINWGPYKGSGVGYDWGVAYIKQFLSIICHMQPIQWEFLTEN